MKYEFLGTPTNKTLASFVLGSSLVLGLGFAENATAACSILDATANGSVADECVNSTTVGANVSNETSFVNDTWQGIGDPFFFIGKYDFDENAADGSVLGYVFTVSLSTSYDESDLTTYKFDYSLTTDPSQAGTMVDWVLGIKQASGSAGGPNNVTTGAGFTAYLWESIELDILGSFNSFFTITTPGGTSISNAYSHATGFLRFVESNGNGNGNGGGPGNGNGNGNTVPEPGTLALMGGALFGLWAVRRRKET